MTRTRTFLQRMAAAWDALRSANHAAEPSQQPLPGPGDLERLGISVVAFGAINKN